MELRASKRTGGAMAALGLALMLSVTGAAPGTEMVANPEAGPLLSRSYRAPFVVPELARL